MKYLTFVKPINCFCFNLPMNNCVNYCEYGKKSGIGYCVNSFDYRFNEKKRLNNQEQIDNNPNFERDLINEIKLTRHTHFRINSIGDFNLVNGDKQLKKILNVCKKCPNLNFWITTHSDYILNKVFPGKKKLNLKNVSIQLSNDKPNIKFPEELKKYYNNKNISVTETTKFKTRSTCKKSINWDKKNASCGSCTLCFNQNVNTVFYLHGKYALNRLAKYEAKNE